MLTVGRMGEAGGWIQIVTGVGAFIGAAIASYYASRGKRATNRLEEQVMPNGGKSFREMQSIRQLMVHIDTEISNLRDDVTNLREHDIADIKDRLTFLERHVMGGPR